MFNILLCRALSREEKALKSKEHREILVLDQKMDESLHKQTLNAPLSVGEKESKG